jgi:pimeloyl-ACP methyl ester carboxylesterase
MPTMVLVRGAWDGGFCWDDVVPHLQERGHTTVVIDRLPSAADASADVGGLADDVAVVRAALDEAGGDVVLVGHSYGGMVITEVADHPAIGRSVYVAAFWPPAGMSLLDLVGDAPPADWFSPTDDGVLALGDFDAVHRAVAADFDRAAFMPIYERMGVQSLASFATPSSAPPRSHPTTYVICTQDRAIAPDAQERMARGADDVVRLDSAHCPMFSMPGQLADVLHAATV